MSRKATSQRLKNTSGQRAKGCGQRWLEQNLRGVLTLRALHQSDRVPARPSKRHFVILPADPPRS
jgi:hypothetical protein